MFRFHPLFWIGVALLFMFVSRRRRWAARHWAMDGGFAPEGPWGYRERMRASRWNNMQQAQAPVPQPLAQPDATLVESLESRIAELEQRLDFAERVMANKQTNTPSA